MVRPITDTLRALRNGHFIDEASEDLARIVNAVSETGKSGKLTIEITVKKAGQGRNSALSVQATSAVKLPKQPIDDTLMFPTPDGNLLTEDPRQQKLDLKVASVPSASDAPLITAAGG
ncbi:hypothetical protein [Methyloversatilis discipulorum]|uniref:hypothetical protein n=1 Tax=Methyloversatilis discipulorum TaxID=1119528 RepID=UPI001A3A9850|nr:hypothetical protein [Methyloversatilis discipulorum]MBL8469671.1 hypothetical protein [Methyloversatilis discipulorum]